MDSQREVESLHRIAELERKVDQLMKAGGADVESAEGWGFSDEPDPSDASDLLPLVRSGKGDSALPRAHRPRPQRRPRTRSTASRRAAEPARLGLRR